MNVSIENVDGDPVRDRKTELVERKGLGHPDSISDGIAEAVSRKLSRAYRDRFGRILHHNTDEVQLVAGSSRPELGGGELKEKIYILLTGRATKQYQGEEIPVDRLAVEAAREYIDENFKALSSRHIEFESRIGETSTDLKAIFNSEGVPRANDTSFGVGHYPLSPTEKTVRTLEDKLHSGIEEVGEDVKVMGLRNGKKLELTVAAAIISGRVSSLDEYLEVVEHVRRTSREHAEELTDFEVEVDVNAADRPEDNSVYLTVTGSSAEMGDDGSVGRGNRVNGLITPHRSMSLEAASGKNPVSHVGKLYNLMADRIAKKIYRQTSTDFAEVKLLSQIGSPVDKPQAIDVEVNDSESRAEKIAGEEMSSITSLTDDVVKGELDTF
ncbi:MAG: methionine adenosyltransferase [Candidatus Nanohaloarchaea archaeon]